MKNKTPPILFLIFNRPDTTAKVFEQIRQARPERLYIAADGAREHKHGEAEVVRQTRKVAEQVDWKCEVRTLFRDKNLGCRDAVSMAIEWFFEQEEYGIILEDDCLPHPDFFPFMSIMLEKYKDDPRIMMVSGDNFQRGNKRGNASYFFFKYPHIWGWGSWRRAWEMYDVRIADYPKFVQQRQIENILDTREEQEFWLDKFERVYSGDHNTWDYQWVYKIFSTGGLTINPNANLITNIGFGDGATHTHSSQDPNANIPLEPIGEMVHPDFVIPNREAEIFTREVVLGVTIKPSRLSRIKSLVKKLIR